MRDLRNSARPLCQNVPNLDETIMSEGDSEEEDSHTNREGNGLLTGSSAHETRSDNERGKFS